MDLQDSGLLSPIEAFFLQLQRRTVKESVLARDQGRGR